MQLHYLRTKDGREIDFFVTEEGIGKLMIEVKLADSKMSKNFSMFNRYFPGIRKIQLVKELEREKKYPNGAEIRKAHSWLRDLSLT